MIRYTFKPDDLLTIKAAAKANPQKIGEALEQITANHGGKLTPAAVVKAARDTKSVLHKHFEWQDRVAAEAYRLNQARGLVRCIHIENADADSGYARAFLSIRDKDGQAYHPIDEVLRSSDLQSKVLAAAERDLLAFERRYSTLSDICGLIRQAREQLAERRVSANSSDRRVSA